MKADDLAKGAKTAETVLGVALFLLIFWQLTPADVKLEIRRQIKALFSEVDRYRRVRHERRLLESEHWHIGQIVTRYNAGYGPDLPQALRVLPTDYPPGPPDVGGPDAA